MIKPVQTELYAVIGNPVAHSLSPVMMNAAFRSMNVPATYLALQADELPDDLETLARFGFRGLSVTLPHKELAYRLADHVDDMARTIGAVNTLMREGSSWIGCNTDWLGATKALRRVTELEGKDALILGAGGAARAVAFGMKREGARVTVANRCVEKGKALAKSFRCDFIPLAILDRARFDRHFDVVVQCTSVGLQGTIPTVLVSDSFFEPGMVVMETVYRPLRTPFLNAAKRAGATIVHGTDMLVYQGVAQLEWWLSRPIPEFPCVAAMKEAIHEVLSKEKNAQDD